CSFQDLELDKFDQALSWYGGFILSAFVAFVEEFITATEKETKRTKDLSELRENADNSGTERQLQQRDTSQKGPKKEARKAIPTATNLEMKSTKDANGHSPYWSPSNCCD
ncbi:hypothetical protein STEG23_010012, partial [Scotinomys teguina]